MGENKPWMGQHSKCDLCQGRIGSVLYDARTPGGHWGTLCHGCFQSYGCTLGTGRGQKYKRDPETKKFYCVAGSGTLG